jgi:hypothetical protein
MKWFACKVLRLAFTGAVLASVNASATVLFTTFGAGQAFDNNGYSVDGLSLSGQVIADSFSIGTSAIVSDVVLALGYYAGNDDPVNLYVESDTGGQPGAIVATLTQVGTIPSYFTGSGLIDFTCNAGCFLTAGTPYWLVAQEPTFNSNQVWDFNPTDPTVTSALNESDSATGPWSESPLTQNAFEIDTPEPGSMMLFGSGLLGLFGLARRRRLLIERRA